MCVVCMELMKYFPIKYRVHSTIKIFLERFYTDAEYNLITALLVNKIPNTIKP